MQRANREHWKQDRDKTLSEAKAKLQQKTADRIVENTQLAADLKRKLLLRLQRIEAKYPFDATEVRTKQGDNTVIFRIRELTAAYKDLTEDMNMNGNTEPVRIIIDV